MIKDTIKIRRNYPMNENGVTSYSEDNITIIQEYAGGSKVAQNNRRNIFIFEKSKWKDSYGNYWIEYKGE